MKFPFVSVLILGLLFAGSANAQTPGYVSPRDFNPSACGAGSTDDTATVQAAINATPDGGTLFFGNNVVCIIKGSGTAALTRTIPINMLGTGFNSGLVFDASAPSTRTMLFIQPLPSTPFTIGYNFSNMTIAAQGASGDLVQFSSTSSAVTTLESINFDNVLMSIAGGLQKYAVRFSNLPGNANGGFVKVSFRNGIISGGVRLEYVGDTILFDNMIITGENIAISGSQVPGAGNLVVSRSNITGRGGALQLDCAVAPRITTSELEQQFPNTSTGRIVYFSGSLCAIDNPIVETTQIQSTTVGGVAVLIEFGPNITNPMIWAIALARRPRTAA
jgi:hypothetical protein